MEAGKRFNQKGDSMMKKFFCQVLYLLGAVLTAASLYAAEHGKTSGKILIRGSVEEVCELAVVDLDVRMSLTESQNGLKVGSITETCNHPEGYVVSLKSANGGFMMGPLNARSDYRIHYDSIKGSNLSRAQGLYRDEPNWYASHDLRVQIEADERLPAGVYRDRLLVEIAAP